MKKLLTIGLLMLLLTLLLCACGCKHSNWLDADCDTPKTCADCGVTEGNALGHTWQNASCETAKTCSACGAVEGEPLGHVYNDGALDCENPKVCSTCGKPDGNAKAHTWQDATCDAPKTCSACGMTEGEPAGHTWGAADCSSARACSVCGITDGAPLGHSWIAASCEAPKTCENCGTTEGKATGHNWADATCILPKLCKNCFATEGKALGHEWVDATTEAPKTCSRCGETDGSKLEVDPRFHTEQCKVFFGKWKEHVTETMEISGKIYSVSYWAYYDFQADGTCVYYVDVDDKDAFAADYYKMLEAALYATYAEMGYTKEQVDPLFLAETGITIQEYCQMFTEEYMATIGQKEELVYYVEGNRFYTSPYWNEEFYGATFEVVGNEIHITNDGVDDTYILIPLD